MTMPTKTQSTQRTAPPSVAVTMPVRRPTMRTTIMTMAQKHSMRPLRISFREARFSRVGL